MALDPYKNRSLIKTMPELAALSEPPDWASGLNTEADLENMKSGGITQSSSSTKSTTVVVQKRSTKNMVMTQMSGTVGDDGQFIPGKKVTTVDQFNDHHVSSESSTVNMNGGGGVDTQALTSMKPTMMVTGSSDHMLSSPMSSTPMPSLSLQPVGAFGGTDLANTMGFGNSLDVNMDSELNLGVDASLERQLALENEIMQNLKKTQETFQHLLNEKRDLFVKMFPKLKQFEATSDLFKTEGNYVTTKEGNVTTTVVKSQRQMATSVSQTFVNGVKKSGKVRAMMVYHGPTQGCTVNMQSDQHFQDEASETEDDSDRKSISSAVPSEFSDESLPLPLFASEAVPKVEGKKKLSANEKAWYVVDEMVETENRYVKKLELLDQNFRKRIEEKNADYKLLSKDKIDHIFCNVSALYAFHNDHLFPKLLEARRDWQAQHKLSHVFVKLGPQLKLYGEYNSKRKRGTDLHRESKKQSAVYRDIVTDVESLEGAKGLPIEAHMIEPVQRVPRYELLLQQYAKLLPQDHPDFEDTKKALEIVQDAAKHANDIISKMEEYKAVLRVQQKLGTQIVNLVTPTRRLVLTSNITKISSNDNTHHPRTMILFNDMLLLCSLPSGGNKGVLGSFIDKIYKIGVAELKLRAVVAVDGMQVMEGDRLDVENTFYIRGLTENKQKTIELKADKSDDKKLWMETMSAVITDHITRMKSFNKNNVGSQPHSTATTSGQCPLCGVVLNEIKKEKICSSCGSVVCKKCCSKKALGSDRKDDLVCIKCYKTLKGEKSGSFKEKKPGDTERKPSVDVKPTEKCLMKGYLYITSDYLKQKGGGKWEKLYFVFQEDFVLYSFAGEKDIAARTSLPIAGCKVEFAHIKEPFFKGVKDVPKTQDQFLTFKITHSDRVYYLRADTAENMTGWMAILELASKSVGA